MNRIRGNGNGMKGWVLWLRLLCCKVDSGGVVWKVGSGKERNG